MKKGIAVIVGVVLVSYVFGAVGQKVFPLNDLNKPESLVSIDEKNMYVLEGTSVLIYALKDFKLIKKFGKKGEGPKEFMVDPQIPLAIDVLTENILVHSLGKTSWYSKKGEYISELKLPNPMVMGIRPFGKHFIGVSPEISKVRAKSLRLFDKNMKSLKVIARMEDSYQEGKGVMVLNAYPLHTISDQKLFLAWGVDFNIRVLDLQLKELYSIKYPIEKQKVTDKDKKSIIHYLKTDPKYREVFELMKPIRFPHYFPAINQLFVSGGKIYVDTFHIKERGPGFEKRELLIFDIKGKLIHKKIFHVYKLDYLQDYPYTIHEGKCYQLVEDEEQERWNVHITPLHRCGRG